MLARLDPPGPLRFFTAEEEPTLRAFCDVVLAQDAEPRVPVAEMVDAKLADGAPRRLPLRRHAATTATPGAWCCAGLDHTARAALRRRSPACTAEQRENDRRASSRRDAWSAAPWEELNVTRAWSVVHARPRWPAFYSHPWAWNEIGFGGPAYPRGFMRLGGPGEPTRASRSRSRAPSRGPGAGRTGLRWATFWRGLLKGAVGPRDNDSRYLLDVHSPRPARRGHDAPLRRRRRGRPGDRRGRRGRLGARPAAGPPRLAGRDPRGGPVLAPRRGLGLRRGRQRTRCTGPRSGSSAARTRSSWARTTPAAGSAARWCTTPATRPRFHPQRLRHLHRRRGRRGLADRLRGPAAALRAGRARAAGGRAGLAVGRPAPLPVLARTRSPAPRPKLWRGRSALRDRDAGRAGRHRQRHVRQPAALHLPRLLPAGLQGQRQGQPVRHPPARRARPRRGDPRQLHGPAGRDRRRHRRAPAASSTPARRAARSGCSAPRCVAVAGYSIETPRLLLASTSRRHPARAGQQRRPGRAAT